MPKTARKGSCKDCDGTGQITGMPTGNGLALEADCPTCNGTGRR